MSTRYEKVKGQVGIRKVKATGKYEAYKKIQGTTYTAMFDRIPEARQWRLTFVPTKIKVQDLSLTFGELIGIYTKEHLPTLASSTQGVKKDRLKIFSELSHIKVEDLNPEFVKSFFQKQVTKAKENGSRRMNFNQEIKDIVAILNWYRENINYKYVVPIISKKLRRLCTIRTDKRIKEKLTAEDFLNFFNALDPFYQDVALIQSRIAGRVGEVAGLQFSCVDFKNRSLTVKYVVVYGRRKEFVELKPTTKNGEIRACFITDDLMEVLKRRFELKDPKSDYVFHQNGDPLKYRSIQHAYDHALKKVGLDKKTSGTHMLKHFTATLTRLVCGNLDAVQSVTGHKTAKLVEHYGAIAPTLQSDSIRKVEEHLREKAIEMKLGWATAGQDVEDENCDETKQRKTSE